MRYLFLLATAIGVLAHDTVSVPTECVDECIEIVSQWKNCGNNAFGEGCKDVCNGKVLPAFARCAKCQESVGVDQASLDELAGAAQHVNAACLSFAMESPVANATTTSSQASASSTAPTSTSSATTATATSSAKAATNPPPPTKHKSGAQAAAPLAILGGTAAALALSFVL